MTGNLSLLCNFVEKYLGTVHFGNDQFALILGYGDLVQGNITINRVYYVEGLNHNLFSVGQFCDADLEVAFQKSTCFVRDLQGNDLLTGNRGTDLYTISLQETTSSTPICLMAKASPTQAWLWHRRLSHLNFDYINLLSKKDVVIGLPKLKYVKDQLCSSCEVSKAKQSSFKSKTVPSSKGRLNLLHMDLCGPMRVASINRKKYILVIIDDYSRYTWTLFLRSKDETPEVLKDFLTMIQRNLQAPVISVRTDRGTEFLNKTLNAFFKEEGIEHQTSTPRTPEQNGVVERRNRTLVEAARTMLSASKLPLFFWAEAIATACYTQNRSIIIPTHEKTAYHIINDRKPSIKHLHIFGCTCYLTRDGENLDKMKEKGDSCILVGYSTQSKGYRVYNKRTRLIVESIHLRFDEIKEMSETSVANDTSGLVPQRQKASDYDNPDPAPELQNVFPSADTTVPSQQELDLLFGPLYDEFFNDGTSRVNKSSSPTDNSAPQDTNPSTNIHPTSEPTTPTNVHAEENNDDQAEFTNPFCTPVQEAAESSSRNLDSKFNIKVPLWYSVSLDKSKIECYNCHRKWHFARECRSGRSQGRRSYGDNVEPVNYALMAISSSSSSSSSDSEVQKCSKCLESFKCLQKNCDTEREKHNKAKLEIRDYEIALESLESRIIGHEKNELTWGKTNDANTEKPKSVSESVVSNPKINRDSVIIEDWTSDDEEEVSGVQKVRPETRDDKSGQNSHKQGVGRLVSIARPVSTARPSVSTARPVSTASPNISIARHGYAFRPIYPRMDN
ncbi:retrovirus-related pol polyprotein from transposon TNT 1-94, partial [Tanacetum coccineum]